MLISQRIAKDPNFLVRIKGDTFNPSAFDMRMKIIHATKVLAGKDIFNMDSTASDSLKDTFKKRGAFKERTDQFLKYVRMPFPSIFIENETGGTLVESTGERGMRFYSIINTKDLPGYINPILLFLDEESFHQEDRAIDVRIDMGVIEPKDADTLEQMKYVYLFQVMEILDVLLFMNAANLKLVQYTPTKLENKMVPKPLILKYTYYVLDVFRTRKVYESMADVMTDLHSDSTVNNRRAHMVRGHWKTIRGKLFWWNPFMRNRRHREIAGEVVKDYRLIDE